MTNSVMVQLSQKQIERAVIAGALRELRAIRDNLKDRYNWERDGWKQHIEGAMGEVAASVATGLPWTGEDIDTFKGADVGDNVQVRFRPGHYQDLSIRKGDSKKSIYVLVLPADMRNFIFEVVGWISAKEGMEEKYYHEDKALYFVPKAHLHDITTLPGYIPPKSLDDGLWG